MSSEASPRPWRLDDGFACEIVDATGRRVFTATSKYAIPPLGDEREAADAALIVAAVNGREHLRDLVRRLAEQLADTVKPIPYDAIARDLIREARAAIGEGEG